MKRIPFLFTVLACLLLVTSVSAQKKNVNSTYV